MKGLFLVILLINFSSSFGQQPFNFISSPGPSSQGSKISSTVNSFTGKLGLSVPIYQYKSPSSTLAFGVSLDYSTGGLNLNQNPSAVGTGWNLNAGGSIHRTINGKPDDIKAQTPGGYDKWGFSYAPAISNDVCPFLFRNLGYYPNPDNKVVQDSEPDEFQFSFLGKQGTFIIPKNSLPENGYDLNPPQPMIRPQSNLKFAYYTGYNAANISTKISKIIITDDNGIEYTFDALETTRRKTARTIQNPGNSSDYHYEYDFTDEYYVTAWNLTKIKSLNSDEEITLEYESYNIDTKTPKSLTVYRKKNVNNFEFYTDDRNYEKGSLQRLKSVTTNNGEVVHFEYDNTNRCDYLSDKALKRITIESSNGNSLMYDLNFVYYSGNNEIEYSSCYSASEDESRAKWLFLKSVSRSVSGVTSKISEFEYIRSSNNLGSSSDNLIPTRKDMKNQDLWGFYNGGENTTRNCASLTPTFLCQYPDERAAEIGSLKSISYPTGGTVSVEYEGNSIKSVSGDLIFYGVRVKKIIESDGINPSNDLQKEYKYIQEDHQSSGFSMPEPPSVYTNDYIRRINGSLNTLHCEVFSSSPVSPLSAISGSPVAYSRVEEVTTLGKTVTEFRSFADQPPLNTTYTYPYASKDRLADWIYGLPKKQLIYDQNGTLVKSVENSYNAVVNTTSLPEFKSMKSAFQTETTESVNNQTDNVSLCIQNASPYQFKTDSYYPVTGRTELTQRVEENYLKDGRTIKNTVAYEYDADKFYLKKVTSYNSLNDKIEKIMFYPHEYSASSATYKLVQKNMQSLPVSSISILTKQNGNKYITGFEKSEFQQLSDLSVRPLQTLTMKSKSPVSISSTKTTFTPEENYGDASLKLTTDVTFNSFDAEGKTLQTTSKETVSSAIWDNEQKIVVAKANASKDDIAFSSFETTEKGNWSYNGNGFYEITAPAGKKCFNLTGNTIFKSDLTSTTIYIVSYRSKNGSYNVNGTSPFVSGTSVNGWTYYKHKVSGVQSVAITGNGLIDELRLHPETARMTSVTYEPLVGVTSESGTEEEITKYEYDSYGRVIAIKNQFGNIIKAFCYNSAGQPSSCGDASVFKSTSIAQIFYKSNCGSGQGILYTVPQGRYISFISQEDADAQAIKDLKTYGTDNITVGCSTVTVYAKLRFRYVRSSGSNVYGDIVVNFFADAGCTQALYVSKLLVSYYSNSTSSYGSSGTQVVTATGSSIVVKENVLTQWQENGQSYSTQYYLSPSSNYQIAN